MDHPADTARDYSIPGMQVTRATAEDAPWPLIIRTTQPRPNWQAHAPDPFVASQPVPTTILYDGHAWRIHEVEARDGEWFYRLRPWPAEDPWMQAVELDRVKLAEAIRAKMEFTLIQRLAHSSIYYEILLGWLPSPVQIRLAHRLHFSPSDASRNQGLAQFFIGCMMAFYLNLSGTFLISEFLVNTALFWALAAFEGALRWAHAMTSGRPCGWLVFEVTLWLYRLVRRRALPAEAEYDN